MQLAYYTADAFTNETFQGAQIAVLPESGDLDTVQMQNIAAEFNLSETVFITAVEESQKIYARAFSPRAEVPVFGHPLVAAAHVAAASGLLSLPDGTHDLEINCNEEAIELAIKVENGLPQQVQYAVSVCPRVDRFVPTRSELAAILNLSVDDLEAPDNLRPLLVACPRPYLVLALKNRQAVRRAKFDFGSWSDSSAPSMLAQEILLVATDAQEQTADFHGRLVGPEIGVNEDPPVGAALPALAAWLCEHDHIRSGTYPFAVERGSRDTRHSLLHVEMDNLGKESLRLRIGGSAVVVCEGRITLPS